MRNERYLLSLAAEVQKIDPSIKCYVHEDDTRILSGLCFIKKETINFIHFHEVPYRWSGCGFSAHEESCYVLENPFTANDVTSTFQPITTQRKKYNEFFKTVEQYVSWHTWLKPLNERKCKV